MRRTARALIKWSNKLEPPTSRADFSEAGQFAGRAFAARIAAEERLAKAHRDEAKAADRLADQMGKRAIQYGGQVAGMTVPGLMETFEAPTLGVNFVQPWALRIADGIAGARPALPNMVQPKPSLWRRIMAWFGL
ncbi:hypothetical protein [Mycolicibacterium setense]|uniref:hypothetical protein n=1 Tax=Mycolicibacterium setense TaxID=431269 RepID=UPI001A975B59|nr:hypothetical protein [Mycolicibacterium setense]